MRRIDSVRLDRTTSGSTFAKRTALDRVQSALGTRTERSAGPAKVSFVDWIRAVGLLQLYRFPRNEVRSGMDQLLLGLELKEND